MQWNVTIVGPSGPLAENPKLVLWWRVLLCGFDFSPGSSVDKGKTLSGIAFGLGAYGIWGFFPLFFRQLGHVSPVDLLCNRAAWGCVFVSLILTVTIGAKLW